MYKYIVLLVAILLISGCEPTVPTVSIEEAEEKGSLFFVKSIVIGTDYIDVYLKEKGPQIVSKTNQPDENLVLSTMIRVETGEELIISDGDHASTSLLLRGVRNKVASIRVEDRHRPPMEDEEIIKYQMQIDSNYTSRRQ